jgi:hypothetical protein
MISDIQLQRKLPGYKLRCRIKVEGLPGFLNLWKQDIVKWANLLFQGEDLHQFPNLDLPKDSNLEAVLRYKSKEQLQK